MPSLPGMGSEGLKELQTVYYPPTLGWKRLSVLTLLGLEFGSDLIKKKHVGQKLPRKTGGDKNFFFFFAVLACKFWGLSWENRPICGHMLWTLNRSNTQTNVKEKLR